jgi:hypothetical protein
MERDGRLIEEFSNRTGAMGCGEDFWGASGHGNCSFYHCQYVFNKHFDAAHFKQTI